eukprot:1191119-Prorocentrum_minimum.AAC.1
MQVGEGLTALHLAASKGHVETVRALVGLGSDVLARCGERSTALIWAASAGKVETVSAPRLGTGSCWEFGSTDTRCWVKTVRKEGDSKRRQMSSACQSHPSTEEGDPGRGGLQGTRPRAQVAAGRTGLRANLPAYEVGWANALHLRPLLSYPRSYITHMQVHVNRFTQ